MSAALHTTQGLCLRIVEYGESDRIVHLLTPDRGRIAAIAKHARKSVKRFPGSLDLFNHLEVELRLGRGTSMSLVERARLVSAFLPLRTDPRRYGLGSYLMELLGRLAPEGGAAPEMAAIFEFALAALRMLETARPHTRTLVLLELRALETLGLRPELRLCVRCGKQTGAAGPSSTVGFHVADGGVVCDPCAANHEVLLRVHPGTLRALEQSLRFSLAEIERVQLPPAALAEALTLVGRFQRYHVGVELRSQRFLADIL